MKKETVISSLLLVLGFVFECMHFATEGTFLGAKFWLIGIVCIVVGTLGLWIYTILPMIAGDDDNETN